MSRRVALRAARAVALVAVVVGFIALGAMSVVSTAAVSYRARWTIQPTPNAKSAGTYPARPTYLWGVSCSSGSSCTAVGDHTDRAGTILTFAEHWSGDRWSIQRTPNVKGAGTNSELLGVSCTSASACIAVGYSSPPVSQPAGESASSSAYDSMLAERWNGTNWTIQSVPAPSGAVTGAVLNAVSCTSASACTAVGYGPGGTLAERWNGTDWTIQSTPNHSGGFGELTGISCTSASACTAVGGRVRNSFAERWNGTSWTLESAPKPSHLTGPWHFNGVSCTSALACTAVGSYSRNYHGVGLVERWNGTRWVIQSTPNLPDTNELDGVSCAKATVCTAVGIYYRPHSSTSLPLAERWDGTRWTFQAPPPPRATFSELNSVSCASGSACTGAGWASKRGFFLTLAERYQ